MAVSMKNPEGKNPSGFSLHRKNSVFFFLDVEDFGGAGFDAGAADDAFVGSGFVSGVDDEAEGADFRAFAAVDAFFLIDGVYTEFVLFDSFFRAAFGAFAALDAGQNFEAAILFITHTDAGLIFVHGFVESVGASNGAGQTGLAFIMICNG